MPVQTVIGDTRIPVKIWSKDIEPEAVLDEIPGAYKDIDTVMENQNDLVEIVAQLKQIMCVKG